MAISKKDETSRVADIAANDDCLIDNPTLTRKLNCSRQTARRWRLKGVIPPPDVKVGNRPYWSPATLRPAFPGLF